jgi:hypothetical protein
MPVEINLCIWVKGLVETNFNARLTSDGRPNSFHATLLGEMLFQSLYHNHKNFVHHGANGITRFT